MVLVVVAVAALPSAPAPPMPMVVVLLVVSDSSWDSLEDAAEEAAIADMLTLAFDLAALDLPPLALPAALAFISLPILFSPPVPSRQRIPREQDQDLNVKNESKNDETTR